MDDSLKLGVTTTSEASSLDYTAAMEGVTNATLGKVISNVAVTMPSIKRTQMLTPGNRVRHIPKKDFQPTDERQHTSGNTGER